MELSSRLNISPVPYAPTALWVAARLQGRQITVKPRDLARCRIFSKDTPMVLSIPIEGGASTLKRISADLIRLSDHGQWRRQHARAITTVYHRFPFFDFVADSLLPVYDNEFQNLEEFNNAIVGVVSRCLHLEELSPEIEKISPDSEKLYIYKETAKELSRQIYPGLSVLDALFRLGPDATFPLLFALD